MSRAPIALLEEKRALKHVWMHVRKHVGTVASPARVFCRQEEETDEAKTGNAVNQSGYGQMQKSEFADHLVLKCQIQSVRFADRRKIIRKPSKTAGDRDRGGGGFTGCSQRVSKRPSTRPGPMLSDIQMNQLEMLDERLPRGRLKTAVKFRCEGPCASRGT